MLTSPADPPPPDRVYPVFVKRGDARAEVDALLAELQHAPDSAGFHKYLHVARADQTVVLVVSRDAPLARALRARPGWDEPEE